MTKEEAKLADIPRADITDPNEFQEWYLLAEKGDSCVYHVGCLATDRVKNPTLAVIADMVRVRVENGLMAVTQRRLDFAVFSYVAVKTGRETRK